ncbi:MAG: ABC transporter ATP-binding protein [Ruminococcaceae bacterium]|nr:ABC transporter ATP-binding protein [Oscillospiraceae bacterium]
MKNNKFSNLKFFSKYYKPYIGIIVLDLICACLSTLCELVLPMIVRYITQTAQNGATELLVTSILRLGALYLFLKLVDTFANYYMSNTGHVMGARIETDMRRDMFSHLLKLSFSYYDSAKVGQIMSRISNDLFDITEFAHHCPEELFICGIKIVGSFIILCGINVPLTLIIFALLPLMLISVAFFRKSMKNAFKKQREQIGELNAQVEDCLLGIRVVKSFANEEKENQRFEEGNGKFFETKKNAYKYMARFHACTRFFDGVMYVAVITIGSLFMVKGHITAADMIAYLLYIQTLIASIRKLVEFTEQFQRGLTGIERFTEIMNTEPEIADKSNAEELCQINGDISFKNITFSYSDNSDEVLSHINIDVKKGENIAIVGPSGSGKTTLCNLLPRFYELTDGEITIDGKSIKDVSLSSLRSAIGVVQQDVYLFSGTVRDNIIYGCPDASDEEIIEAAKNAGAHEFILSLPDGYNTYVGERGVKLSGGQKQRVSIARLFLKNPPILILDEATSALDNESELLVQKSLESLAKNRTTFTIAHRLTTIRNATKIIVLTEDGISETGTHAELMEKGGEYSKLYGLYTSL